jgi:hypothetical protein
MNERDRELDEQAASTPVPPIAPLGVGPGSVMPLGVAPMMPGMLVGPTEAMGFDAWNYRPDVAVNARDLAGYAVEATDGRIGKVDRSTHTLDDGYLIVDIGHWIFGRKAVVPAGVVNHVDRIEGTVYLGCTKEQLKGAPDVHAEGGLDESSRTQLLDHYGK